MIFNPVFIQACPGARCFLMVIMRKFFCNTVLLSALSLLGGVSFSPSLFGQELEYPPEYGGAPYVFSDGLDISIDIGHQNPPPLTTLTLYYVFLQASEDAPTRDEIDANPDRGSIMVSNIYLDPETGMLDQTINPVYTPLTHTFTTSGEYILHGYFWDADIGTSAVSSSNPFTLTDQNPEPIPVPVFSAPTVAVLEVTFTVTHEGTADYTFHYVVSSSDDEVPSLASLSMNSSRQSVPGVAPEGATFSYTFSSPGTYRLDGYFESATPGVTEGAGVVSSADFTILHAPSFDTPTVDSNSLTFTFTVTNDGESTCTLHYTAIDTSTGVMPMPGFTSEAGPLYDTEIVGADSSSTVTADVSGLPEGTTYEIHGYFDLGGTHSAVTVSGEFTTPTLPLIPIFYPPYPTAVEGPFGVLPDPIPPLVVDADISIKAYNQNTFSAVLNYAFFDSSAEVPGAADILAHATAGSTGLEPLANPTRITHTFTVPSTYVLYGFLVIDGQNSRIGFSAPFAVTLHLPSFSVPTVSSDNLTFTVTNPGQDTCTLHYAVIDTSTGVMPMPGFTSGTGTLYDTEVVGADSSSDVTADASGLSGGATYSVHGYFDLGGTHSPVTVSDEFTVLYAPRFGAPQATLAGLGIVVHNDSSDDYTLHYQVLANTADAPAIGFTMGTHYATATVNGNDSFTVPVVGFSPGMYRLHGYFEAGDGGLSGLMSSPAFTVPYTPRFDAPVVSGAAVRVTAHNDGPLLCTLHYLVLDTSLEAPSPGFTTGPNYGTMPVSAVDSIEVSVQGLSSGHYVLYAYFSSVSGTSALSETAPFNILRTPRFDPPRVVGTTSTLSVHNDGAVPCTLHYVLFDAVATAPPVGFTSGDEYGTVSVPSGGSVEVSVPGLEEGSSYRFYLYFSYAGVVSSVVSADAFRTLASPVLVSPVVSGTSVRVSASNGGSSDCTLHYVVLSAEAAVPAPGFDSGDNYGMVLVPAGDSLDVAVSDLSGGKYVFYVYFSHADSGVSPVASSSEFVIIPVPRLDVPVVSRSDVRVTVHNDGAPAGFSHCILHYVVRSTSEPAPPVGFDSGSTYGTTGVFGGGTVSVDVTGLSGGTYRFYAYFSSTAGFGSSEIVSSDSFVILPVPVFLPPVVGSTGAYLGVLNSTPPPSPAYTFHYVVQEASAAAPAPDFSSGPHYDTVSVPAGDAPVAALLDDLSLEVYTTGGTYVFYGYFSSEDGDTSSVVRSGEFTTYPAPVFLDTVPSTLALGSLHTDISNPSAFTCDLHYVLLEASAAVPDYDSVGYGVISLGPITSSERVFSPGAPGLYRVHAYFSFAGSERSVVVSSDVLRVLRDPALSAPTASDSGVTFDVSNSGVFNCTLHYVVLSDVAAPPTLATHFTSEGAYSMMTVPSGDSITVSVPLSDGRYTFYAYFETDGDTSAVASSAAFRVGDPPPSFADVPTVSPVTDTSVEVSFSPLDAHEHCWVLLLSSATAPSRDQVLRGEDGDGNVVAAAFRSPDGGVVLSGDDPVTIPLSGLSLDTSYTLYVVLANAAGDAFSDREEVSFTTAPPPPLAPVLDEVVVSPFSSTLGQATVDISVTNAGITDCTLHYVVLAAGTSLTAEALLANANDGVASYQSRTVVAGDTVQLTFEFGVNEYVFYSIFARTDGSISALTTTPVAVLTAPALGAPVVSDSGVTLPVTNLNAAGHTLCYLFLDVMTDAPDTTEVFEDQGGAVWVSSGAHDVLLPTLLVGTYTLYVYFHGAGVGSVLYTHPAPLRVLPVPVVSVASAPGSGATVSVSNSDPSNTYDFHYVVLFADEETPSASYILDNSDDTVQVSTAADIVLSGLSGGTCRLYGIFADGEVLSLVARTDAFTILHAPRLEASVFGDLSVTVHNDGPTDCVLHYLVLDESAAVPAPGFDSGTHYGMMPVAAGDSIMVSVPGLSAGDYRFHAYFSSVGDSAVASTDTLTILHTPSLGTPVVSGAGATIPVTNATATSYNFFYVVLGADEDVPSVSDVIGNVHVKQIMVGASATEDVVLSDLSSGAYRFYGFFGSNEGSTSAVVGTDPITILHAPRFPDLRLPGGFPTVSGSEVELTLHNDSSVDYTLHYVVLAASEGVPAPGFDTGDTYDTQEVDQYGTVSVSVPGLSPGSSYIFHAYFSDGTSNSAVSSSVAFTVLHAPVLSPPVVSGTELSLSITNNGPTDCVLQYQVLDAAEAAPPTGFTSGPHYGTMPVVAGDSAMVSVPGLSAGSSYILHAYFSSVGDSVVASSAEFTILHAPVFEEPMPSGTDLTLTVQNGGADPCTLHYVVLAAMADALAPGFITGDHYSTVSVPADGTADVSVSGLSAGTYRVHGYFSLAGARSSVVRSDEFTVTDPTPILSAPVVSGTGVTVSVTPDDTETYTLHYVVLDASEDAPATDFTTGDNYDTEPLPPGDDVPVSVSGLSPGSYIFHAYLHDGTSPSEVSSSDPFTVLHSPRLDAPEVSGTGVSVTVYNDGPTAYALHYVVQDASEAAPAPGFTGTDHGMVADGANVTVTVTDLAAGSYIFHAYFSSVGDSAVVSSASFTIVPAPQITSLAATGAAASFNIINSDPFEGYTLYYVFLESSAAAPTAQEIRDHAAAVDVQIFAGPPPGTALTHTFSESGMYRLHAYFESAAGFQSEVTSSTDTVDVTVASFLPVLDEPVVAGSEVSIMITNNDAASYDLFVAFSPLGPGAGTHVYFGHHSRRDNRDHNRRLPCFASGC